MKSFLTVTAVIEAGIGVALIGRPSTIVDLLLGARLDLPAAVALGRVAGAALLALGVACRIARDESCLSAAPALVIAMLIYNLATVTILACAGIGSGLVGLALWPAVVLHGAMAAWCLHLIIKFSSQSKQTP